jgi:hypothetical protein
MIDPDRPREGGIDEPHFLIDRQCVGHMIFVDRVGDFAPGSIAIARDDAGGGPAIGFRWIWPIGWGGLCGIPSRIGFNFDWRVTFELDVKAADETSGILNDVGFNIFSANGQHVLAFMESYSQRGEIMHGSPGIARAKLLAIQPDRAAVIGGAVKHGLADMGI